MPPRSHRNRDRRHEPADDPESIVGPRIIGGTLRGRKLPYSGDSRTRPMKDRVREAVFNLVGPAVVGMHAIDLFAGTGALGLEAISRGAARGTFFERHFPTADQIRRAAAELGVGERCTVIPANTLIWFRRPEPLGGEPWLVFCSPPYSLYVDQRDDVLRLVSTLTALAPPGSIFVVEADERFDFTSLPDAATWDVREYPPAFVGIRRPANKGDSTPEAVD